MHFIKSKILPCHKQESIIFIIIISFPYNYKNLTIRHYYVCPFAFNLFLIRLIDQFGNNITQPHIFLCYASFHLLHNISMSKLNFYLAYIIHLRLLGYNTYGFFSSFLLINEKGNINGTVIQNLKNVWNQNSDSEIYLERPKANKKIQMSVACSK